MIIAVSVASLIAYLAAIAATVLAKTPTGRVQAWTVAAVIAAGTALTWTITGLTTSNTSSLIAAGIWAFVTFPMALNGLRTARRIARQEAALKAALEASIFRIGTTPTKETNR